MSPQKNILSSLKESGHRLTVSRREILEVLTNYPMTVQEILDELQLKKIKIDLVTIYRTLELLINAGFIQKIQFGDKLARYELKNANEHHHHLVCEACGMIEDISFDEQVLANQVKKQSNFQVRHHTLEFFGLCPKCQ